MRRHDRLITEITRVSDGQDRGITRRDLQRLGATDDEMRSLRGRHFLHTVFPGTYVFGSPDLTDREFLRACVLHAGPRAYPTHRSGAELRTLLTVNSGFVTVTTRRSVDVKQVRTRRRCVNGGFGHLTIVGANATSSLPLEWVNGFETTTIVRTLVDLAARHGAEDLRRAWREATFLSLLDEAAVQRELDAMGRPGVPLVRERLRNAPPVTRPGMVVRSRAGELRFLELLREAGLPEPLVNSPVPIDGVVYRPDFLYLEAGLAIETDGTQHDLPEHKRDDQVRQFDFASVGITLVHVSNDELRDNAQWYVERVRTALEVRGLIGRAAGAECAAPVPRAGS